MIKEKLGKFSWQSNKKKKKKIKELIFKYGKLIPRISNQLFTDTFKSQDKIKTDIDIFSLEHK